jgi:hypothetical protein
LHRDLTWGGELVNFNLPPSRLLDRAYRQATKKAYKKTADGKQLFRQLDPNVAALKCPRLMELLEEMLRLAHGAGL